MSPTLRPEVYVFCPLPPGDALPNGVVPFATVREDEGLSVIIERRQADALGSPLTAPFRAVTLAVCSSLHAVGFIAVVARALADAGIAANVISGFHHDYVFVPAAFAEEALHVLRTLAARA